MTANHDVNMFASQKYQHVFGELGTFRLLSPEEMKQDTAKLPRQGIFSYNDDYLNLNEVARDFPMIHELPLRSVEHLETLIRELGPQDERVPLFIKYPDGFIDIIPADSSLVKIENGEHKLVYMGKKIEG